MKLAETISSNQTGLYVTREVTPGVVPQNAVWSEREPNEYGDFGSTLTKVSRNPINATRQRKKGTVVGQSVQAGYTTDLTARNMVGDFEAFLCANARTKSEVRGTGVLNDGITVPVAGPEVPADGLDYPAGTLIHVEGSPILTNNGFKITNGAAAAGKISVVGLAVSAAPVTVRRVGFQFATGTAEIEITASGLPSLTAGIDMTTLGVIPGEVVYLGGDGSAHNFTANDSPNRGYCRVYSVSADAIVFDKTPAEFVADPGTGKTIQLFFGSVIKNERLSSLQTLFSHSVLRSLGAPDTDAPSVIQGEVVTGAVANELTLTIPEEDKLTAEIAFIGRDYRLLDDISTLGATYLGVDEADAINSTVDSVVASMVVYEPGNSAPLPIFSVFQEFELSISNNISENKAVTRFGAFNLSPGMFDVNGSFTGYFVGVDACRAVRNNADVSFMFASWKENKGFAYDLPMLSLSMDGLTVEQNEPITIDIDGEAATGKKYSADMDHTILCVFFDYLPNSARNLTVF